MKKYLLASLLFHLSFQALAAGALTQWENPAVLCPEEILPQGLTCLDFSKVKDPLTQFPEEATSAEILDWKNNKAADLRLCRNQEIIHREELNPGTFGEGTLEVAWMIVDGAKNISEKLEAIEAATKSTGIPAQILIGALKQESGLSSIGLSPDGGNFSCGMAQLNIQEWCQTMNRLPKDKRIALGWPSISCDEEVLPTNIVKPLYDIAIKNAGNRPSYLLTSDDFKNITYDDVKDHTFFNLFSTSKMNHNSFKAAASFAKNCQNSYLSIISKAQTLKSLFDNFVPKSLREAELYSEGQTFPRICKNAYSSKAYPLHTGWLLAVGMYNAGPLQAKLIAHYYQVKDNKFPAINPLGLIEALHWGGKWKEGTDNVVFADQSGKMLAQKWFKSCIVQRHVARVIQHVTLPAESIAKSLDREGCKMTGVPDYRKISSGIKDN